MAQTRNQKNERFAAINTELGQSRAAVTKESKPERCSARLTHPVHNQERSKRSHELPKDPKEALIDSFRCPLSAEIMSDPVILCNSGISYERIHIDKWLSTNSTDPLTGRPLRDRRLIPNPCLRALIASCCRALGVGPAASAAAPAQGEATIRAAAAGDPPDSAAS
eukprot:CAMPEP_0172153532 /NCGR_PEP_ID=MMETSP1050-20130122/1502_1 /TAXON_ID=233186 /ORGANISM="Cryptomonas curvata, Strain CCAP979/52" /LENGTH=165 /DNA_ID=CAMNT_0012822089 /DNA_START=48 /DNA_END=545 /DNA_ORIENTATION=+